MKRNEHFDGTMSDEGVPHAATSAASLWPNLEASEDVPTFSPDEPIWDFLDPANQYGLKAQLTALIERVGRSDGSIPEGVTIDESNGPVIVRNGASIEAGAMLIGPCYIAAGAAVRHGAYIRSNSWLCSGSLAGHATEVKHSVLLPNAKAPHFNYVGDSILGGGVNLGAGCKLSNLRHDGRNVLVRGIRGGVLDSGIRKFGAILGEDCQLGCNAVTNPGVILGKNSHAHPNTTISGVHNSGSIIT